MKAKFILYLIGLVSIVSCTSKKTAFSIYGGGYDSTPIIQTQKWVEKQTNTSQEKATIGIAVQEINSQSEKEEKTAIIKEVAMLHSKIKEKAGVYKEAKKPALLLTRKKIINSFTKTQPTSVDGGTVVVIILLALALIALLIWAISLLGLTTLQTILLYLGILALLIFFVWLGNYIGGL